MAWFDTVNVETVNQREEGIEIAQKGYPARPSHLALIDALKWRKGPLTMLINAGPACFDMFWLSFQSVNFREILNALRTTELDTKLHKFDRRILHIGPLFPSLYWVTSGYQELKAGRITVDLPLFGSAIRYLPGIPHEEIMHSYERVREFFQDTLLGMKFVGAFLWGYLDDTIMDSNMFYFEAENICVNGSVVHNGKPLDKSLFFEFPELMSDKKPKRFYFHNAETGSIHYETTKMKLRFYVYDAQAHLQETIEVPFREFKMNLRPDILLFTHNVPEDSMT